MPNILIPEVAVTEKILRAAAVYLFILAAFRFTGKRQVGQLTPFDLVVLLIISNVVQNAMIGKDDSLGGGLIGAVTILVLNFLVVDLTFRSKKARRLLENEPTILIHNGKIFHNNLEKERVSMDDLMSALRKNGISDPRHVRVAMLEENGGISVIPHKDI